MDISRFIRPFRLRRDAVMPSRLAYERLFAVPLSRENLMEDLAAVNSSRDLILRTRGGSWPSKELTQEENFLDLAWHEREFKSGNSFAYVVHDQDNQYVGCFYLYPLGIRTFLSPELAGYDVDVSWWVTADFYSQGYYKLLYIALVSWIQEYFVFEKPYFSNQEIPR